MSVSFDNLPSYLTPLPTTDPRYTSLNESAYQYAYGPVPGEGNLKQFEIVEFQRTQLVYRLADSASDACGYWWLLPNGDDDSCFTTEPPIDRNEALEIFAICPEWNNATLIMSCTVGAGEAAVIGIGQSANCSNGLILDPPSTVFQLNGPACDGAYLADGYCSFCEANPLDLQSSACVQTCATDDSQGPSNTTGGSSAGYHVYDSNVAAILLMLGLAAVRKVF